MIEVIGRRGNRSVGTWIELALAVAALLIALALTRRSFSQRQLLSALGRLSGVVRWMIAAVVVLIGLADGIVVLMAVLSGNGHSAVFWGTIVVLVAAFGLLSRVLVLLVRRVDRPSTG
jgi:hypothetical protein